MNISSSSGSLQLYSLLASLQTGSATSGTTGQDSVADSSGSAVSAAAPPPLPPPPNDSAAAQFSEDTLSSLISSQGEGGGDSGVSGLASKLIGSFDGNSDGQPSLPEIETALTGAGSTTGSDAANSDLASAFSALDTDGHGELSPSELESGLETLAQAQGPGGPPPGPGSPPSGDSATSASASASSATASIGSGALSSNQAHLTTLLQNLLAQLASTQYANANQMLDPTAAAGASVSTTA